MPALTVRTDGSQRTFAPGNDVVIGRDLRADVRVAHPLVSRAHIVLRFDHGRWVAIDNGSENGIFVDRRRVRSVDISDGQSINISNPDGPRLTFEVGRHMGAVGGPPSGPQPVSPPGTTASFTTGSQLNYPTPIELRPSAKPSSGDGSNLATSMLKILRPARPARAAGRDQDRPRHRQRHRHPRRAGVAPPRHAGARPRGRRDPRQPQHQRHVRQRRARRSARCCTTATSSRSATSTWCFAGGTLVRRTETEAATRTGGLEVHGVTWTIEDNKTLLDNISLAARPGTLTAVIGPSGAGKSTFARLIAGYTHPTSGTVSFEGHDIHAEYASLRVRIGMVPQDDVVHGQLTVNQALMYAAELRLPPDTTKDDREQVVAQVLEELEMTQHADTRVDKLSGGQRKRASVAMELLTGPSLLILDEPTSGLDPALDRQVMTMLRQLADAGRVVLVVTHSLTYLDVCDQVLLLAPGGKTAFCGPPSQIGRGDGHHQLGRHLQHRRRATPTRPTGGSCAAGRPAARAAGDRQADRSGQADAHQPAAAVLDDRAPPDAADRLRPRLLHRSWRCCRSSWVCCRCRCPATSGFGVPVPMGDAPNEPGQILVLLNVGAIFMGTALTIRDLIGERAIFLREQAVGLSTTAYLLAKVCVFAAFAILQSAIVVGDHRLRQEAARRRALWCSATRPSDLFVSDGGDRASPRRWSAWRCRRWPSPTSRSCRCWWSRSCRSWCSTAA